MARPCQRSATLLSLPGSFRLRPDLGVRWHYLADVVRGGWHHYHVSAAQLPRAGSYPGRKTGPQPRLPTAAGREGTAADRGRHHAAAGGLPPGRTRHDEPELLRPGRALRPATPRLRLQAQADPDTTPPLPPPIRSQPLPTRAIPRARNGRCPLTCQKARPATQPPAA